MTPLSATETDRQLVERSRAGDITAFTRLATRYQNLAFSAAFARLHDFHAAQDVTQEAFLSAYRFLNTLQAPERFGPWLRGIVHHQCSRVQRRRREGLLSLDHAAGLFDASTNPVEAAHRRETQAAVEAAVGALPPEQREVIVLYYLHGRSQKQTAELLGIPVTIANNRLHSARQILKKRMLNMVTRTIERNALPADFPERLGQILSVQGPVIEARFSPDHAPRVLDSLTMPQTHGAEGWAKVVQRLPGGRIRAVATSDLQKWEPGLPLANTPEVGHVKPIRDEDLASSMRLLAGEPHSTPELLETGIKVIDLLCPLAGDGTLGIFSVEGVGRIALVMELYKRLESSKWGQSLFPLSRKGDVSAMRDMLTVEEGYPGDAVGKVQSFWLVTEKATDFEFAQTTGAFDSVLYLSTVPAAQGLWPAVDGTRCRSRLLEPSIVGDEHVRVAARVRETLRRAHELMFDPIFFEALAHQAGNVARKRLGEFVPQRLAELPAADRVLVQRARKLERYFTQPFYVAETFTGIKGTFVSRERTIRDCVAIVDGEFDDVDESKLLYIGSADQLTRE